MSTARPRSAVALLADVPGTGQLGDVQAHRFAMEGDDLSERVGAFVDFTQTELAAGNKVVALYPSWRSAAAERAIRFARGSRRTDHIAGIGLNLAPLTLSLVADQLAYLAPYVPPGIVAALADHLPSHLLGGAWLRTVSNLAALPTTMRQHVLSFTPRTSFIAVCAPNEFVQQATKDDPTSALPGRPYDPVQMLVSAPEKANRSWIEDSLAPALHLAGVQETPEQPLGRDYWGTAKYVEFVAFSAHPQALSTLVNSLQPATCRWCAEPVCALSCPFCGAANLYAVTRPQHTPPMARPEHVPAAPPPPTEEERRAHLAEQERRRLEEEERERSRRERIEARRKQREQEEAERREREREEAERREREEAELLRRYREQQQREEEERRAREEAEQRRKEEEERKKRRKEGPVVHVHVPSGQSSTASSAPAAPPGNTSASGPMPPPPHLAVSPAEGVAPPPAANHRSGPEAPDSPPSPAHFPAAAPVQHHQHHHEAPGEVHQHNYYIHPGEAAQLEGLAYLEKLATPEVGASEPEERDPARTTTHFRRPDSPDPLPSPESRPAEEPEEEPAPLLGGQDPARTTTHFRRPDSPAQPEAAESAVSGATGGGAALRPRPLAQAPWALRGRSVPYGGWRPPVEHERPPVSPDRRIPRRAEDASGPQQSHRSGSAEGGPPETAFAEAPLYEASRQRIANRVATRRRAPEAAEGTGEAEPRGEDLRSSPAALRWWEESPVAEDESLSTEGNLPGPLLSAPGSGPELFSPGEPDGAEGSPEPAPPPPQDRRSAAGPSPDPSYEHRNGTV